MQLPARKKKHGNHERWVVSYADLVTLLLAFFVVLYASSTRDKAKMAEESASLLRAFHGAPLAIVQQRTAGTGITAHQVSRVNQQIERPSPREPHLSPQIARQMATEILTLDRVRKKLEILLQPLMAKKQVAVTAQPLTLTIQLDASVLFPDGQATLTPPATALLVQVANSLTQLPQPFGMVVQGYTDDRPIATTQFPSNWSLSAERAVTVVRLLETNKVDGNQLSAEGFGQYEPIASNQTPEGRAQNRRVVLVIHAPGPDGR